MDAGAPEGVTLPKHLFPAEATINLVGRLPEEYRPSDAVLKWLANGSKVKATACPLPRTWYSRLQHQASDNTSVIDGETDNFRPKRFIGNGWPVQEHVAEPGQRLQDAAQAIVYTLEEWVMPHPASESPHGFSFIELVDLHAWVSLLVDKFPGKDEGGPDLRPQLLELQQNLNTTLQNIQNANGQGALCISSWRNFVRPLRAAFDGIRANKTLLTPCRTETCRVWSLLHILSVANLARTGRASAASSSQPVQNGQIFDAIIQFLRRYFTCSTCRQHFLEQVEAVLMVIFKPEQGHRKTSLYGGGTCTMLSACVLHRQGSALPIGAGLRLMSAGFAGGMQQKL